MFDKIKRDGHIHTHYCPHGCGDKFETYIENAIERGLEEITFTEHMPLPTNFSDPSPLNDSAMRHEDVEKYIAEVNENKLKYKDKIKINFGFEVDFLEGYEKETIAILEKYGEYIEDSIISTHMLEIDGTYNLVDWSTEFQQIMIDKLGSLEKVYEKYYDTMKKMVLADLGPFKPKRVGHINLIRKFQKDLPYDYSKHKDQIEEIMKLIKEKGMELDYNVSGIRKPECGEVYVEGFVLDLAKKYDIPLVFGSDSHSAEFIGLKLEKEEKCCCCNH